MRYLALACDYDGTIADHGRVSQRTVAALESLLATGRKLVLVTGRELDELLGIFPEIKLFQWVVAENGALLYCPATGEEKVLAQGPPPVFAQTLAERGVTPMSVGRVIVATWEPHESTVLATIRDLGLELQVIFNKGAVMVLPTGVSKATGFAAALKEMGLSPHEAVGVGDAENDHALLSLCECSAAVANALPAVKQTADLALGADHGDGVAELIGQLVADDLQGCEPHLVRHHLLLGTRADGTEVKLPPYGPNILIAGPSASGKSTVATGLMERLAERQYQFCVIDPEGDYEELGEAVVLGSNHSQPTAKEVVEMLVKGGQNVVVNLVGMRLADRPTFFLALLPQLLDLRARTGRPHWLLVDEAHHLLPAKWEPGALALPGNLNRTLFITVHPDQVATAVLASVGTIIAVGPEPATTITHFCQALDESPPVLDASNLESREVLLWRRHAGESPLVVRLTPSREEHRRHRRKYAEGELPPERSFYFRGPEGKLNLRAQNLFLFLQLADGVDAPTWTHHVRAGDVSRWFREQLKDETLAAEAEAIEQQEDLPPAESRELMRQAIERLYTLPAAAPPGGKAGSA